MPGCNLGVYSDDELEERIERDITPAAPRVEIAALTDSITAPAATAPAPATPAPETTSTVQDTAPAEPELVQQLRDEIEQITTVESATALRARIEEHKATLGITAFTELKGKAVKRYHRASAMTKIEKQFDELSPDLTDAQQKFHALETAVAAAQRHLDPQEYTRFATALDDMRAEYVV